jgi:hypothetical protein
MKVYFACYVVTGLMKNVAVLLVPGILKEKNDSFFVFNKVKESSISMNQ